MSTINNEMYFAEFDKLYNQIVSNRSDNSMACLLMSLLKIINSDNEN